LSIIPNGHNTLPFTFTHHLEVAMSDKKVELADMKMVKSYVNDLRNTLDEGPLTDRRAFIRSFVKEIAVTQQEIQLNYTLP